MWASEDSEIRAQYSLMADNFSFARHHGPLSHYPLYDVDVESRFESTAPLDSSGPVSNIWSRRKAKGDACDNCRRLRMKCVFQLGNERCKRCQDTGETCSKASGPRNPYRSRGLAIQVEDKNRLIDSLLSLVHSPRRDTQPPNIVETQQRPEHSPALVMPDTQNREPPRDWGQGIPILDKLKTFFLAFIKNLNVNIAIIDPCLHTFDGLRQQSPFLMTVICAVASRFSIDDQALYPTLMSQVRALTAKAVRDGWKSLEDCQAYLLLSLYPLPAVNRTEDRSWYFLGCAISMALDLRLYDQGPARFTDEIEERKQLVRTRIWLMCFNIDRGLATKLGRPTTMFENHAVKYSLNWCWHSQYNDRQDLRLCLHTQLLRTVTKYLRDIYSDPESLNNFNKDVDFRHITSTFDIEMEAFRNVIAQHCANAPERDHPASLFRLSSLSLEIEYHRMVLYSFGLQRLNDSNPELSSTFLAQSVDAATEVLRIAAEDLTTYDLVQYSPDEHWRWPAFAAVWLIKLATPHASKPHQITMAPAERDHSLLLVQKLIDAFERNSADAQHAPARYARFLRRIIKERNGNSAEEKGETTAETSGEKMEDILEGIYSLDGNFWENALAPGTWGILSEA
ncbi:hypothetical protein BDV93DRAFT_373268 [Ceratobasidium sp. AG-I]|nr:hypothetical protein BDV93DRAFT_373268 [Ceratobasidium sp. AG-I]